MQRSAQAGILAATGRYVRKLFADVDLRVKALESRPAPQDGKSVTVEEFRGLLTEIVDDRLGALPKPRDGEDGKSLTLDDVRPMVAELVEERVKALPAQPVARGFDPGDFDRFADVFLRRLDEPLTQ